MLRYDLMQYPKTASANMVQSRILNQRRQKQRGFDLPGVGPHSGQECVSRAVLAHVKRSCVAAVGGQREPTRLSRARNAWRDARTIMLMGTRVAQANTAIYSGSARHPNSGSVLIALSGIPDIHHATHAQTSPKTTQKNPPCCARSHPQPY